MIPIVTFRSSFQKTLTLNENNHWKIGDNIFNVIQVKMNEFSDTFPCRSREFSEFFFKEIDWM